MTGPTGPTGPLDPRVTGQTGLATPVGPTGPAIDTAPKLPQLPPPDEPLSPFSQFTRELSKVNPTDIIDLAIQAKRLMHPPWATILGSAGFTSFGAGLGAWIAGKAFTSTGVLTTISVGFVLLVGAVLVRTQRAESTGNFCTDFMRFIDRWPPIHEAVTSNSAYVAQEAAQREPSWLVARYRERRAAAGQKELTG
jgi:hypothetical protein